MTGEPGSGGSVTYNVAVETKDRGRIAVADMTTGQRSLYEANLVRLGAFRGVRAERWRRGEWPRSVAC